jgi:hypothetical protein
MVFTYDARILQSGQRIVSDTSLLMYKIYIPTVSIVCPYRILVVSGHHRFLPFFGGRDARSWKLIGPMIHLFFFFFCTRNLLKVCIHSLTKMVEDSKSFAMIIRD